MGLLCFARQADAESKRSFAEELFAAYKGYLSTTPYGRFPVFLPNEETSAVIKRATDLGMSLGWILKVGTGGCVARSYEFLDFAKQLLTDEETSRRILKESTR